MSRSRSAGLPFIFITLVIDMIGLGVIIPVVPALVSQLAGPALVARELGIQIALYALAGLLTAPTLGALSDRFGRRPVLLAGTALTTLAYILAVFAPSLGWLFVARTLGGIGGGTVGVAYAYVADVSTPETRARHFGFAGAAFSLGLIIGPALGGLLGQYGLRLPFIVSALLAALNFLYGLLILPESRRGVRTTFDPRTLVPLRALTVLGRIPGLPRLALVLVFANLAMQFLTSTWVLNGLTRYGWSTGANGLALTVAGLVGVPVQLALLPWVLRRVGPHRTFMLGGLAAVIGNLLYGLAAQGWMVYAVMPVAALGSLALPPLQAIMAGKVGPETQGALQGALAGLGSLCAIVGPLLATTLFSRFASPDAVPHVPGIAFFAASLAVLLSLLVFQSSSSRRAAPRQPA